MKWENLKDSKWVIAAAGAAAVPVIKKIVTSDTTRKFCVSGLAKGMKLYQDAQETVQNIRDDAEDLCYEAKCSLEDEEETEETDEV